MAKITIVFGAALIVLGVGSYLGTGRVSVTALIPAFFGLPVLLLGVAALRQAWRKHAMHAAVALAALALIGTASQALPKIPALVSGEAERPSATAAQLVMLVLCAVFVGLAVASFVRARRAGATGASDKEAAAS